MPKHQSVGPCIGCQREFKSGYIKRHIKSCEPLHDFLMEANPDVIHQRMREVIPDHVEVGPFPTSIDPSLRLIPQQALEGKIPAFLIMAHDGPYWMILLVPQGVKLYYLDRFLRMTWLECCRHLSSFRIQKQVYYVPTEMDAHKRGFGAEDIQSMRDVNIEDVLAVGDKFSYTYDFGTSTDISLEVIDEYITPTTEEIFVLARNRLPNFDCDQCGKRGIISGEQQRYVVRVCDWCRDGLCELCSTNHDCESLTYLNARLSRGEEPHQALINETFNSPRNGECGYYGPEGDDFYKAFEWIGRK